MIDTQHAAVYLVAFFFFPNWWSRATRIPNPRQKAVAVIKTDSEVHPDWTVEIGWWIRAWCCWARIWALRWEGHRSAGNCLSHGSSIQISIWAIHHLEGHFLPVQLCRTAEQSVCISVGFKNITHCKTSISNCHQLLMFLGRPSPSSSFMHALKTTHKYVFRKI